MKLPKSKHKLGYTNKEILDIIRPLKIHHKTFNKKFGVNTCTMNEDGKSLYYAVDILRTIRIIKENREMTTAEWD